MLSDIFDIIETTNWKRILKKNPVNPLSVRKYKKKNFFPEINPLKIDFAQTSQIY